MSVILETDRLVLRQFHERESMVGDIPVRVYSVERGNDQRNYALEKATASGGEWFRIIGRTKKAKAGQAAGRGFANARAFL